MLFYLRMALYVLCNSIANERRTNIATNMGSNVEHMKNTEYWIFFHLENIILYSVGTFSNKII